MTSRRSHQKSRLGCRRCKERRIKCDERHPVCSGCQKHNITCDFSLLGSQSSSPAAQATPRNIDPQISEPGRSQSSSSRNNGSLNPIIINQAGDLHMGDLELLHHFLTSTCFTTSNRPESHELWRVTVPREGLRHDFLMRGIFAIAALHLSHIRQENGEYYRNLARSHQDEGLRTFNAIMPRISQTNCHAFFAYSSLLVVYTFASPRTPGSLAFVDEDQDSGKWLQLIRGVNSILMYPSVWPWVENGPLRGLLQPGVINTMETRLPKPADHQLRLLAQFCENPDLSEEVIGAYQDAVKELRKCYAKIFTRSSVECEVATAFTWPVEIPQKFIEMLNNRAPEALIILAHYCVVLHHLDDYWWIKGWAAHLIQNIYAELGGPYHGWIQWPSDVIERNERCLVWRPLSPDEVQHTPHPMSSV